MLKPLSIVIVLWAMLPASLALSSEIAGDYRKLSEPPKLHSLSKITFDEYLNFTCPHCNNFRKAAKELKIKHKDSIVINYIPILFQNQSDYPLRLFYIAQSKGKTEEVKELLFSAAFEHNVNIYDPTVINYLARVSGLAEEYKKEGNADWVNQRLHIDRTKALDAGINSTPTVVLAGTLVVTPKKGMNTFVANLDQIIQQLLK